MLLNLKVGGDLKRWLCQTVKDMLELTSAISVLPLYFVLAWNFSRLLCVCRYTLSNFHRILWNSSLALINVNPVIKAMCHSSSLTAALGKLIFKGHLFIYLFILMFLCLLAWVLVILIFLDFTESFFLSDLDVWIV